MRGGGSLDGGHSLRPRPVYQGAWWCQALYPGPWSTSKSQLLCEVFQGIQPTLTTPRPPDGAWTSWRLAPALYYPVSGSPRNVFKLLHDSV